MCGRTSLFIPLSVLEERFDASTNQSIPKRYNIAPRDDLVCIRNDKKSEFTFLNWGLIPGWADDPNDSPRPINARAESVDEKSMFRDAFNSRRCLVIADGYYEWGGERGTNEPYRIELTGQEPFAMAGLWESWSSNGTTMETVTVITTDANEAVSSIHDRMPVILEEDEEETWLSDVEGETVKPLLDPFPSEDLKTYPISSAVNDPSNDSPEILEERSDTQSGLDDFL